jgi:hypothetical protein
LPHPPARGKRVRLLSEVGSHCAATGGRCTGVLIFLFIAFQFFVLAFVDFPTISQLKGN